MNGHLNVPLVAGGLPPIMADAIAAAQREEQRRFEAMIAAAWSRRLAAERRWATSSPAYRYYRDARRFLAELLADACPPHGYLYLLWDLMEPRS